MQRRKKLSVSLSLATAALVVACVAALSVFSVLYSSTTVRTGIQGEFEAVGGRNAGEIQMLLNEAETAAEHTSAQLERMMSGIDLGSQRLEKSVLPGFTVSKDISYIENYIKDESAKTVLESESIIGMGAFFEPYAFDPEVERYALYMDESSSAKGEAETYPEDYSAEEYYSGAVRDDKIFITDPFKYFDINMITVAQPIHGGGKVVGVICVDISLDAFSNIQVEDEDYPTMFAGIVSDRATVVFDSSHAEMIGKPF